MCASPAKHARITGVRNFILGFFDDLICCYYSCSYEKTLALMYSSRGFSEASNLRIKG